MPYKNGHGHRILLITKFLHAMLHVDIAILHVNSNHILFSFDMKDNVTALNIKSQEWGM